MERRVTTSTVPVSTDVLKGQQAIAAREDANRDIMDEIAVTVVAKTALSPVNVTDLQDNVTLVQPTHNLVHAQRATTL